MPGGVRTATAMGLREFRRTPVLLALLAFLPAYVIGAFVLLVPDTTLPVVVDGTTISVGMVDLAAAFMTPVPVAILSGIVGLFLVHSSRAADDRLRLAGLSAPQLLAVRVGTLGLGVVVVSAASVLVAVLAFSPAALWAFVLATVLVGLTYGILGVIVGVALDRLGGVYVMLFAPMVDVLMFQNPLVGDPPFWTVLFPGHFATDALFAAAFTGDVDPLDFVGAVGYAFLALLAGAWVLARATRVR